MNWHVAFAFAVVGVGLVRQFREGRINALALCFGPLIWAVLAAISLRSALHLGLPLVPPAVLAVVGLGLGWLQGRLVALRYDPARQRYLMRGGIGGAAVWVVALLVREVAVRVLASGLTPAEVTVSGSLTIDAVLLGLFAAKLVVLGLRQPLIWRLAWAQLRGETTLP